MADDKHEHSETSDDDNFQETTFSGVLTLEVYQNQAGGHSRIFTADNNAKIVKPLNPHEKQVYESLQHNIVRPFTAHYYGVLHHDAPELGHITRDFQSAGEFIVLENLTAKYKHPCVLDIKLGHRAHVSTRDTNKAHKYQVKYAATTAVSLGFRISGIRVYRPCFDNYLIRKSIHCNRLLSNIDGSLHKAMTKFLNNGVEVRTDLAPSFVKKLEQLHHALTHQREFDFVASSVLLIYEGDSVVKADHVEAAKVDVRLIDFDHTAIAKHSHSHADVHPHRSLSEATEHKPSDSHVPLHGIVTEDPHDMNGVARGIASLTHVLRKLLLIKEKTIAIVQPSLLKKETDDVEPRRHRSHSDPNRIHQPPPHPPSQ